MKISIAVRKQIIEAWGQLCWLIVGIAVLTQPSYVSIPIIIFALMGDRRAQVLLARRKGLREIARQPNAVMRGYVLQRLDGMKCGRSYVFHDPKAPSHSLEIRRKKGLMVGTEYDIIFMYRDYMYTDEIAERTYRTSQHHYTVCRDLSKVLYSKTEQFFEPGASHPFRKLESEEVLPTVPDDLLTDVEEALLYWQAGVSVR